MASRPFARMAYRRTAVRTVSLGIVGFASTRAPSSAPTDDNGSCTLDTKISAADMFAMSSQYCTPSTWGGRTFKIRNDYPGLPETRAGAASQWPTLPGPGMPPGAGLLADAPWLNIDFRKDPNKFCEIIKEYCWEGNVNNDFVVQNNKIRDWYHAPWMHASYNGREPLNGLTFERPTPAFELAETQNRILQTWACGYYNAAGATAFREMWEKPESPKWDKHMKFPLGTCVFKILMTDATREEVPTLNDLEDSPSLKAVIAEQPKQGEYHAGKRNDFATDLRLLQVDFAVRDDRAPIGWVFGTFMYDGSLKNEVNDPWNRIIPVGIMWGNDPKVTQAVYDEFKKEHPQESPIQESWINPEAEKLRLMLKGKRPSWGWNGRMNGPADNFVSACASCHSTAQYQPGAKSESMVEPVDPNTGRPDPTKDSTTMRWFRNLPSGVAFSADTDPTALSADYSLQMQMGYYNFLAWQKSPQTAFQKLWHGTKYVVPGSRTRQEWDDIEQKTSNGRSGPQQRYDEKA